MIDKSDMFPTFMKKRFIPNQCATFNRSARAAIVKTAAN
jgi:hypothetical protein